jgi:hypothetical protein
MNDQELLDQELNHLGDELRTPPSIAEAVMRRIARDAPNETWPEASLVGRTGQSIDLESLRSANPTRAQLRPRLFTSVAAAAAISVLTLGVLFLNSSTQNQAYAQMAVRMNELKSFVYYACQVDAAKLGDLESVSKQKVMYMAPSFYRSTDGTGVIQIADAATRQSILLDANRKEALRLTLPDQIKDEMTPLAFVERLRSHFLTDRDSVRELGKRVIDGKAANGFQSDMHGDVVEVWLDPQSKLPVEVRMRAPSPKGIPSNELAVTWQVLTGFTYDAELDEKMFVVAVPEGYHEVQMMTASVKALSDRFDRFAAMLRKCAEHNDSVFPTSLKHSDAEGTCFAIVAKYSLEWAAKRDAASNFEEKQKIAVAQVEAVKDFLDAISEGLDFLKLPQDKLDFHYFPGARLNQADRPVAWFSPDGLKTYRVLYADLIVRETEADALPRKPEE